jgi:predicted ABC-type transport system involved in lysophospholipase L1 biosynthesis ATPase subunit
MQPSFLSVVEPVSIIALIGLGGSGVAALWSIANGLGRFEARTTTILEGLKAMLVDHEERLREIERKT